MGEISIAEVLRLRATSAISRDKSVKRSAQDDESVEVLTKSTVNKLALGIPADAFSAHTPIRLLSSQSFHRIHRRRTASRQITGEHRRRGQNHQYRDVSNRVHRTDPIQQ